MVHNKHSSASFLFTFSYNTLLFRSLPSVMENVCGLNVKEVTEVLASGNSDQILIIDCRSFLAFNQGRIVESVNIHCPPILKRRSGDFIALENIVPCEEKRSQLINGVFLHVLVYDDNTQELNKTSSDSNLLSVIKSLLKQIDQLTIRFIIGGFEAVREECPVLCVNQDVQFTHFTREKLGHKDRKRCPQKHEPAEILPHLYLGDVSHSSQRSLLDQLGITALLNVSSCCENHFQTHYQYMNIQINDNMEADLFSWFPKVIEFIDKIATERGKVLVHCRAGVSRSATVCIAYIMNKQGLSLDSAFEFVMTRRPIIDPNLNFIQQLQKFENSLKSKTHLEVALSSSSCHSEDRLSHSSSSIQQTGVFSFSPEHLQHEDMESSSTPTLMPAPSLQQKLTLSLEPPSPVPESQKFDLSPCSLSQTAASPSFSTSKSRPAARPDFLPLLQISTPLTPLQPRSPEVQGNSSFLLSPVRQTTFPVSPLLNPFLEPEVGSEAFSKTDENVPKTPLNHQAFSFFSGDVATCQSFSIPLDMASPRPCRPTTPAAIDSKPVTFFNSEHTFPSVGLPHSPISPLGVPLSPLPSFG